MQHPDLRRRPAPGGRGAFRAAPREGATRTTPSTILAGVRLALAGPSACSEPRQLLTQASWREELRSSIAPPSGALDEDSRLIWLLQRPDHVFIDANADVLCEGLARMRADRSRYKSLMMSHWGAASFASAGGRSLAAGDRRTGFGRGRRRG